MIRSYALADGFLRPGDADDAVWIDLVSPAPEERAEVGRRLGIALPTQEEMSEIEISSRLYVETGAVFMTALLPMGAHGPEPETGPVTFVLTEDRLVTIRYHEPRAFSAFPARAERSDLGLASAETLLLALLEEVIDRLADILEHVSAEIDATSRLIFRTSGPRSRTIQSVLEEIGRLGDLTSKLRESLMTFERVAGYLGQVAIRRRSGKDVRERVRTLARDTRSLLDHAGFLAGKTTFLLDATLGLINIEQNGIIKIFSVAAVIFLPPTLVASIYGMNFHHMPELDWLYGYPFALGLMVASAILPYLIFKRQGWL